MPNNPISCHLITWGTDLETGMREASELGFHACETFTHLALDYENDIEGFKSTLTLVQDGRAATLVLGEDASLVARAPLAAHVEAPLVFAGYGLVLMVLATVLLRRRDA